MNRLLFSVGLAVVASTGFGCASSQKAGGSTEPCAHLVSLESVSPVSEAATLASAPLAIDYPALCQRAGIEGRVELNLIVTEAGVADSVRVWRGIGGGCDEAAHEALRTATYIPAKSEAGVPVRSRARALVRFEQACQQ